MLSPGNHHGQSIDTASQAKIDRLHALSNFAADEFTRQYFEIRGSWEREDWHDRIEATIRYWTRAN